MNTAELNRILRTEITALLEENKSAGEENFSYEKRNGMPYVVMVVGVNGAGKTTTIGKLASKLKNDGKKVYIGAADTFRAAAIDQLAAGPNATGVTMIRQDMGSDPAVAFDTLRSAVANDADVVLIDTAGRLAQQNRPMMNDDQDPQRNGQSDSRDAPHEVMLVPRRIDGARTPSNRRNNSASHARVTALAITKLDGTAKGGV